MNAREIFRQMSPTAKAQHQTAWAQIEEHVKSLIPKGAKVFEVHHAVEHARGLYHAEMAKGLPADLCKNAVMSAYKTK